MICTFTLGAKPSVAGRNIINGIARCSQALKNGFIQTVEYSGGRSLPIVASPVQFDRMAPKLAPAPEFGADTDEILTSLGMDMDSILDAKISGAVI